MSRFWKLVCLGLLVFLGWNTIELRRLREEVVTVNVRTNMWSYRTEELLRQGWVDQQVLRAQYDVLDGYAERYHRGPWNVYDVEGYPLPPIYPIVP